MLYDDYPYKGYAGKCKSKVALGKVNVIDVQLVEPESVEQLKAAITKGPLATSISAGSRSFQMYQSGIYNNNKCPTTLNHAVNIVGYGT